MENNNMHERTLYTRYMYIYMKSEAYNRMIEYRTKTEWKNEMETEHIPNVQYI